MPPGRTGVTFGYMNWWVIMLAYDAGCASLPVSFVTVVTPPLA